MLYFKHKDKDLGNEWVNPERSGDTKPRVFKKDSRVAESQSKVGKRQLGFSLTLNNKFKKDFLDAPREHRREKYDEADGGKGEILLFFFKYR